jgi:hypothetical protein
MMLWILEALFWLIFGPLYKPPRHDCRIIGDIDPTHSNAARR